MIRVDRSRLPDVGPDPTFTFPEIVRHSLPNGLQVCTVEHHSVPIVTFMLQVEGGSGADPGGLEGLTAVVADMIDEGTGELSAIDVSDALARIGADYDVDVGADATDIALTTLARFAGRGMSMLANLTTRPALRDSDFTRVRRLRLDRLRQLKDVPSAVSERTFLRLVYGAHPYGHLAIGTEEGLHRAALDDVVGFHARCFRPSRALLVACGAMSHTELLRLAEDAFGEWSMPGSDAEAGTAAADVPPAAPKATRLAVVHRERATQSELRIGHLATRRVTPDYQALLVMNALLGGQFVSRVNLKLREQKGYTYGARTSFDWRRGISPFVLQTSVQTAVTADAVADALGEISDVRGVRTPTDEEMSLAKTSLTRGYPRGFETAQQVARSIAMISLYGLPDTYFQQFVPKVNAVATADVVDVAQRYLDPARLTTLIVGDYDATVESLRGLNLGEPQVLEP